MYLNLTVITAHQLPEHWHSANQQSLQEKWSQELHARIQSDSGTKEHHPEKPRNFSSIKQIVKKVSHFTTWIYCNEHKFIKAQSNYVFEYFQHHKINLTETYRIKTRVMIQWHSSYACQQQQKAWNLEWFQEENRCRRKFKRNSYKMYIFNSIGR